MSLLIRFFGNQNQWHLTAALALPLQDGEQPKPAPRSKFGEGGADFTMPDLPSVPDLPGSATLPDPKENKDDIDFDDLTKRFEDLKKKK